LHGGAGTIPASGCVANWLAGMLLRRPSAPCACAHLFDSTRFSLVASRRIVRNIAEILSGSRRQLAPHASVSHVEVPGGYDRNSPASGYYGAFVTRDKEPPHADCLRALSSTWRKRLPTRSSSPGCMVTGRIRNSFIVGRGFLLTKDGCEQLHFPGLASMWPKIN
jgi:hypothetical protein